MARRAPRPSSTHTSAQHRRPPLRSVSRTRRRASAWEGTGRELVYTDRPPDHRRCCYRPRRLAHYGSNAASAYQDRHTPQHSDPPARNVRLAHWASADVSGSNAPAGHGCCCAADGSPVPMPMRSTEEG
eukprot:2672507-Pleurochrysis_carterae.AAC.2